MDTLNQHSLSFFALLRLIPVWLVVTVIFLAAIGFFLRFFFVRKSETLWRYPFGSLAVGVALTALGFNYLLIARGASSHVVEVTAGGVRVFLVLMGISLTYFTRDGYEAAYRSLRSISPRQLFAVLRASMHGRWLPHRWRRGRSGEHSHDNDGT